MGTFAEIVILLIGIAVFYFLLTPLRLKIEFRLNQWMRRRFSSKRERPVIDINDYKKK